MEKECKCKLRIMYIMDNGKKEKKMDSEKYLLMKDKILKEYFHKV
jgi:hypothetical protein